MEIRKINGIWYSYQPNKKRLNKTWQNIINKTFEEYICSNGRRLRFKIKFSNNLKDISQQGWKEYIEVSKWNLIKLFFPFKQYPLSVLKNKYLIFEMR